MAFVHREIVNKLSRSVAKANCLNADLLILSRKMANNTSVSEGAMKIRSDYTCPLEVVYDTIKGKWKTIILYQLRVGKASLSELEQGITGISQKMLLEQLKELQAFGFVTKKEFEGYPLHVEYSLTESRKQRMLEAVKIMQEIGIEYMVEHGMTEMLDKKGIKYQARCCDTHEKVGNLTF